MWSKTAELFDPYNNIMVDAPKKVPWWRRLKDWFLKGK